MKQIISYIFLVISITLIVSGCKDDVNNPAPAVDETNNGFEKREVAEIFANNCTASGCHGETNPQHGLSLTSWNNLIKGSIGRPADSSSHHHGKISEDITVYGGEAVIPFNSERSLLYNLIAWNVDNPDYRMPHLMPKLSDTQISTIKDWIDNGAKDYQGNVPFTGTPKAYVCSQGDDMIYEIDMDHKVVSGIIDVNLNTSGLDQPHNIQVRDNYLYVSLISSGYFLKIDRNTKQITAMTSGLQVPGMIALSPDGLTAFVSRSSSAASIYNSIYAINTSTMQVIKEIILPVTGLPHALALTKDGSTLYVANMSRDRISIVNAATMEAEDEVLLSSGATLEHEPMHIYLSPDDKYLYINCRTSSKTLVMDVSSRQIISVLDIKHHPMQMGISSDGNKLYVVSMHEPFITTIVKNGTSWSIAREFESSVFHGLYGADLTADGRYFYASCSNNDPLDYFIPRYVITGRDRTAMLCIYDTQTEQLVKVLDIGKNATGVAAR